MVNSTRPRLSGSINLEPVLCTQACPEGETVQARQNKPHFGAKWKKKTLKWGKVVVYILIPVAPAGQKRIGSFIQANRRAPRRTHGRDKDRLAKNGHEQGQAGLRDKGADCLAESPVRPHAFQASSEGKRGRCRGDRATKTGDAAGAHGRRGGVGKC